MPQALASAWSTLQMQDRGGATPPLLALSPRALIQIMWALSQDPWWFLTDDFCLLLPPSLLIRITGCFTMKLAILWNNRKQCYMNNTGLVFLELLAPKDTRTSFYCTSALYEQAVTCPTCLQTHSIMPTTSWKQHFFFFPPDTVKRCQWISEMAQNGKSHNPNAASILRALCIEGTSSATSMASSP